MSCLKHDRNQDKKKCTCGKSRPYAGRGANEAKRHLDDDNDETTMTTTTTKEDLAAAARQPGQCVISRDGTGGLTASKRPRVDKDDTAQTQLAIVAAPRPAPMFVLPAAQVPASVEEPKD